jgi:hypothetical protein
MGNLLPAWNRKVFSATDKHRCSQIKYFNAKGATGVMDARGILTTENTENIANLRQSA